ncbi:MAG: phosphodiester glycosidase family protein [Acidimicrobiia bacterium]|nr:phosphodiester glycosidase family protein [Acidimicrobiia bacterium]
MRARGLESGIGCHRNPQDRRLRDQAVATSSTAGDYWPWVLIALTSMMVVAVLVVQPSDPATAQARSTGVPAPAERDAPSFSKRSRSGLPDPDEPAAPPVAPSQRRQPSLTEPQRGPAGSSDNDLASASGGPPLRGARPWVAVTAAEFREKVAAAGFDQVEFLTPNLAYGTLTGDGQAIHVLMIHRSGGGAMRVSAANRGREPVGAWASDIGAVAGVNANWYNPFDGPAVAQGQVYGGADHRYTALFGVAADGRLVSQHHRADNPSVDSRIREAVSGHPTLIHRGTVTVDFGDDPTFTERHPRTAIGATESTDVLIVVTVDGRRWSAAGMTGAETARLLRRLGAQDAVMLDGGGSSAMWIADRGVVNRPSDPGRGVGNQLAFDG